MFSLTLRDHLNVTFNQIIQRHEGHTRAAHAHARWSRRLRGGEALLIGGVSIAAVSAAFGQRPVLAIVAAVLAGAALLVLLVHLTFNFEASAHANAASGNQLWHIRERYRALLSDLHEGVIDVSEARVRRDKLMDDLRAIYDRTPALQSALVEECDVSDEIADEGTVRKAPAA